MSVFCNIKSIEIWGIHMSRESHKKTFSPTDGVLPGWKIGWDVFLSIGYKRFKRHWSVTQIREELIDSHLIFVSEDAIEDYLAKYQKMVAARRSDPTLIKEEYRDCKHIILTVDRFQSEGHEVLYVIREVKNERIWFAETIDSDIDFARIIHKAKKWAEQMGLIVTAWVSDRQDVFVTTIALEFPGTPHRYSKNLFISDISKETLAINRKAQLNMRAKVKELSPLESSSIEAVKKANEKLDKDSKEYTRIVKTANIVSDFCTMIKDIIKDNEGSTDLQMVKELREVKKMIDILLETKKKGAIELEVLSTWIEKELAFYEEVRSKVLGYLREVKRVTQTLSLDHAPYKVRLKSFNKIYERLKDSDDPVIQNIAGCMNRCKDGLFEGGDHLDIPEDNQDFESWFKTPKGHLRRINGLNDAGLQITYEGPTLLPTLDAHRSIDRQFQIEELKPYLNA